VRAAYITRATVTLVAGSGTINASNTVGTLTATTIMGGNFSAGHFQFVTAERVVSTDPNAGVVEVVLVEGEATRTLRLSAASGPIGAANFGFTYDGSDTSVNPHVSIRVDAAGQTDRRYDFSATTDTVGQAATGIDLAAIYGVGRTYLRNVVVAGSIIPTSADPAFFGLPAATPGGVYLPLDTTAVAASGNIPARSIVVQGTPAVAAGFFNGVAAANAKTTDAVGVFAPGTATVQANDAYQVFVGDGTPVAMFLVTGSNGSNFDGKNVLFADQGVEPGTGQYRPVTGEVGVAAAGGSATIRTVTLSGEGGSFQTQQLVSQAITVVSGSLGDLTLSASGGSPANITAPRIVGNIDVTNGAISGTIRTTSGDLGRAFRNAAGNITGVTFVRAGGGGLTTTGQIISARDLVSQISIQSGLDGVVAVQGNIGVIQTDATGAAVVGSGPGRPLTRFGGITVSTGGLKGSVVALGNVFGDINVSGGLDGRIAVKGSPVLGLDPSRVGILGNVNVGGGMAATAAIVSAGVIGDDGNNSVRNDGAGTRLNISGTTKGILAAGGDINFGSVGSLSQAAVFENAASADLAAITAIFTNGAVALSVTNDNELLLILTDLGTLRVGLDGRLTGTTP